MPIDPSSRMIWYLFVSFDCDVTQTSRKKKLPRSEKKMKTKNWNFLTSVTWISKKLLHVLSWNSTGICLCSECRSCCLCRTWTVASDCLNCWRNHSCWILRGDPSWWKTGERDLGEKQRQISPATQILFQRASKREERLVAAWKAWPQKWARLSWNDELTGLERKKTLNIGIQWSVESCLK